MERRRDGEKEGQRQGGREGGSVLLLPVRMFACCVL
jgi:hypothetical protein